MEEEEELEEEKEQPHEEEEQEGRRNKCRILKNSSFTSLKKSGIENQQLGERRGPINPDEPLNKFLKILNMGSVSSRKHEMGLL